MGDEAEGHFVQYATDVLGLGVVRYGLDRPPIQLASVPARLRYTPDFLMSRCLVEVQGVGRDQKVKLKLSKLGSLHHWNDIRTERFDGVKFYVWDSHKKREVLFPLSVFDDLIDQGKTALALFPENKAYFEFAADDVFAAGGWTADAAA